jgi:sterol 3beta-glucosyltransferase
MPETEDEDRHETMVMSEEEIEDDFEPSAPNSDFQFSASPSQLSPTSVTKSLRLDRFNSSGTMATVKMKRRARLADKLRDIFELSGINQVIAGEAPELFGVFWQLTFCRNSLLDSEISP